MDIARALERAKRKLQNEDTPKEEENPLWVAMEDFTNARTAAEKAEAFKAAIELTRG